MRRGRRESMWKSGPVGFGYGVYYSNDKSRLEHIAIPHAGECHSMLPSLPSAPLVLHSSLTRSLLLRSALPCVNTLARNAPLLRRLPSLPAKRLFILYGPVKHCPPSPDVFSPLLLAQSQPISVIPWHLDSSEQIAHRMVILFKVSSLLSL